ncbi:MAG: Lipoprotein LpqB, beta-propeller domain-like protein [Frankiales bacterium]|nr:Lipoprotein LpqB, beta-propeller domain-like protein [Frankiales bacterium]
MRRVLAALLLAAAAGCSLPLPQHVQAVREVQPQRRQDDAIQVLPAGPQEGQPPIEIVQGFLGAQANAEGQHAIARQFLTDRAAAAWRDEAGVQVYDPDRLEVKQSPDSAASGGSSTVSVTSIVSGQVRADGSYVARTASRVTESYQLERVKGQWRLSVVPAGLRLTAADRQRSYQASDVYYLAPAVRGSPAHLVPDQVFLPVGADPAKTLVQRLLQPPSQAVAGSVTSALPSGTQLRSVSTTASGLVTVDLGPSLARLPSSARQALSAQLVWTLRDLGPAFTGLRLLSGGAPLKVPTAGQVQDAGDWNAYDPEGLGPNPPYFFVASRRLHASVTLPSGPATAGDAGDPQAVPVDAIAVTPDRTQVALLDGVAPGAVKVRTGPLRGPYTTGPTADGLSSPTWGSGQLGLWLLQGRRKVVLLSNGRTNLQRVTVLGQPPGDLQALSLSRDGARAALVVGGRLFVGRVEAVAGVPRIVGLSLVLPGLHSATGVAWSSGTELAVLGTLTRAAQVLQVAVDGSSVTVLNSSGLTPVAIAASSAGLLVASGDGIYAVSGRGFTRVQSGSSPDFPG